MRRVSILALAALIVSSFVAPLRAHELPYEVVIYLMVDAARVQVLARVPMPLLNDARLPLRGGYLDLPASDVPLRAVAADVARNLDLMDNGRPLPAPSSLAWAVTRRPDAAFDSYEAAVARFKSPPLPADTPVDPNLATVDVRLEYVLSAAAGVAPDLKVGPTSGSRLSVRVNGFRAKTRTVQMLVHYAGGATPRTFIMTGTPRRVDLEPGWPSVAPIFAQLGMERLALGIEHLLFILCLAIPRRGLRDSLVVLAAFAGGYLVALTAASWLPGPPAPSTMAIVQALVAGALVVAALQNITASRLAWVGVAAAAFGLFDGLSFGAAYRLGLPLAGAHTLLSFLSFAGPVLVASLWLLILIRPLVGLLYRSRIPERWALICLSAIPIHTGLHGIMALSGS